MAVGGGIFWRAVLALVLLLQALPASAVTRALLVGVTDYPELPPRLWLKGPGNDVELMARVLGQRLAPLELRILTEDRPEMLPTRANILRALDELVADTHPGDTLLFFFAGHGSQQPAGRDSGREKDGLDEIFLPRDAAGWDGASAAVRNAITDNEIAAYVTRARNKGAFVVALFDSCHSESMTRGLPADGDIRLREVSRADLGIPPYSGVKSRGGGGEAAVLDDVPSAGKGDYIALYAAQTFELAPEMRLPLGSAEARPQGLFSYTLAQALQAAGPVTWRQLRDELISRYRSQAMWNPTPQMDGTALDQTVFGTALQARRDSWPLESDGSTLKVAAGVLDQLHPGDRLAVLRRPADPLEQRLGTVRVETVGPATATVSLENGPDGTPPDRSRWPSRPVVSRLETQVRLDLGVALATGWPPALVPAYQAVLRQAMDELAQEMAGSRLAVVAPAKADLVLTPGMLEESAGKAGQPALFLAPRTGAVLMQGPDHTHALLLNDPATGQPRTAEALKLLLRQSLASVARTLNLQRLSQQLQQRADQLGLQVEFALARGADVVPGKEPDFRPSRSLAMLRLQPGDTLRMAIRNAGNDAVDMTVLHIDSSYGISALYPAVSESPRLNAGERITIDMDMTEQTVGEEKLLLVAVPGDSDVPRDYLALSQPAVLRARGQGAAGTGAALDRLLGEAQDVTNRGQPSMAPVGTETVLLKMFGLRVGAPATPGKPASKRGGAAKAGR